MTFQLPVLNYAYDALQPIIDAKTMEIHHTKHHQSYINNLNKAIVGTKAEGMSLDALCKSITEFSTTIRNNAGGHRNHTFFRSILIPASESEISPTMTQQLTDAFGSVESFKEQFLNAGTGRFGSGWVWLIQKDDKSLEITTTPNQDNPLMDDAETQGTPLLGVDLREHAYYLHYQNRRADYIQKIWDIINRKRVEELLNH